MNRDRERAKYNSFPMFLCMSSSLLPTGDFCKGDLESIITNLLLYCSVSRFATDARTFGYSTNTQPIIFPLT